MEVSVAVAALFGLEVAGTFGFNTVQIEGDAICMVSAIYNALEGSSPSFL